MRTIKRSYARRSNPIIDECTEEGISINKWMKWHGVNYPELHRKDGVQNSALGSDSGRGKSSWATWTERVNNI